MHTSLGFSGTTSANIEEESDGNRPAGQIYSGFCSSCGWRMLSGWEIGPQQNRLANQNKGLAISSVGSNIWHGGGRRCNHRLWSTNAQHVLLQPCKYLGEGSRRNEAHIILSACIQSPVMLVNVL